MRAYLTLLRRELGGYFVSFTGYVIIALALSQVGLSMVVLIDQLKGTPSPMPPVEVFFATPFFWIIQLLAAPVITMRLFALEKSTGTFETLMTAPVTDLQVVLAKFTAALGFYLVMWLPFFGVMLLLRRYANDPGLVDPGVMASSYLGILLIGCLFLSFGCLASAMTRNQIVAAMTSFAFIMSLFLVSFLSEQVSGVSHWLRDTVRQVEMVEHMQEFARGVVDTRWVVFYLSATVFFLFLTHRVVESRRWK